MTALFLASMLSLTNRFGTVSVDTLGARVVSYVPAGGRETLVMLPSGAGGIPLCWPWFQYEGPDGRAGRKHGLARYREFAVAKRGESYVELVLTSDDETRRVFPHDFRLVLRVRLGQALELELLSENTGSDEFTFTEAFHPYLDREVQPHLDDTGGGAFRTWNPDATSHLQTEGLGPGDWKRFLCVENGTFSRERPVRLRPGEVHRLSRRLEPVNKGD